jgi:hypothetical protein
LAVASEHFEKLLLTAGLSPQSLYVLGEKAEQNPLDETVKSTATCGGEELPLELN